MVSAEKFINLTDTVIQNFEGGYYHPDMKKNYSPANQIKLGKSGETMFGLDRVWGASLAQYPGWKEFWKIIDDAGARTKWPHYYMGGKYAPRLRQLAGQIMFPHFMSLFNQYITPAAKPFVADDPRMIIQFSYASWNGPGWFRKFADPLNNLVKKGVTDKEQLLQATLRARTNSGNAVINQGGAKMAALLAKFTGSHAEPKKKVFDAFNPLSWFGSYAR